MAMVTNKTTTDLLNNTSYVVAYEGPHKTGFKNTTGEAPIAVEVFDDGSWSAYTVSNTNTPERTGMGFSSFIEIYTHTRLG